MSSQTAMVTPMRSSERARRLLMLVAWMALVTYWSGQGNLPIDQPLVAVALHGFQHLLAHLFAFGLMGLLANRACGGLPRAALFAVLITSVFGASDEWHQSFTAGRRPAIDDWATDTAAAAVAIFVWSRLRSTRLHPYLRAMAPLGVALAFVVGIGLALLPSLGITPQLSGVEVRRAASEAVHGPQTPNST